MTVITSSSSSTDASASCATTTSTPSSSSLLITQVVVNHLISTTIIICKDTIEISNSALIYTWPRKAVAAPAGRLLQSPSRLYSSVTCQYTEIKFAISYATWMTMTKVYLLDCWRLLMLVVVMMSGVVEKTILPCHHPITVGRLM